MKPRGWVILTAVGLLLAAVFWIGWTQGWFGSRKSGNLTIGVIFPLSGEAASYGEKGQRAVELARDQAARTQACGSAPVNVVFEDSAASPATGIAAFQKLRSADGADIVIGDVVSAVTLAVAPLAQESHTVLLSPTSSAPAITQAGSYVFRIWPSDLAEGTAVAELASSRGLDRVAVMHMNNDYGTAIADIFQRTLRGRGGEIVLSTAYNPETTEFRSTLTRIRAARPKALYIAGYFADTAIIVRQARALGIDAQLLGTTAIEDENFLTSAGDAANGMIYPLATGFDASSREPHVAQFVTLFKQRFRDTPGWVEAAHYDAFNLTCQAAASVSTADLTSDEIRQYFEKMQPFRGVGGTFSFDSNGDVVKPIVFRTIKNGRFMALN